MFAGSACLLLVLLFNLKMEAAYSSKMLVTFYQTTNSHNPEHSTLLIISLNYCEINFTIRLPWIYFSLRIRKSCIPFFQHFRIMFTKNQSNVQQKTNSPSFSTEKNGYSSHASNLNFAESWFISQFEHTDNPNRLFFLWICSFPSGKRQNSSLY
jgi:hypothetical protein